jgi:hypothetical protein
VGDIAVILECKWVICGKGAEGAVTHDGELKLWKLEGREAESMEIWKRWGGNIYRKEGRVQEARAEMGALKVSVTVEYEMFQKINESVSYRGCVEYRLCCARDKVDFTY